MRLSQLLDGVPVDGAIPDLDIAEVRDDSRRVQPGDLFVAVRGGTVDGHKFLDAVAKAGAAAVLVEEISAQSIPQIKIPSTRAALARLAANRYGRPADALTLLGITGTNGKTTTTFLTEAVARAAGGEPGLLGTVQYRWRGHAVEAPFTTPDALQLHGTFARMREAGCTHVAMECSSHAIEQGRLDGLFFRVAAFTNLTQDHLDFHGTMEAYRDAKARLFSEHLTRDGVAVVNVDNEYGAHMLAAARGAGRRALTVSTHGGDVCAVKADFSVGGIEAEVQSPVGVVKLRSPLIGAFNLENLLVAVGIGAALGVDAHALGEGLSSVRGVPGRLERVGEGIFVDYAHTPDALERVMAALRPLTKGRLIVVFGCGGDRDRTKRPKMGRAVAERADLPIVTSDNPRTEDPQSIVDMILAGMPPTGFAVEVDRRRAIQLAVETARPGDVVLIAGKGHEDYQIVGKTKHHFDDREEAQNALAKLASRDGRGQS